MGFEHRLDLYKQVEARRNRPLIVYVTSSRANANGQIAADSVPELLNQLQRLPIGTKELDLLIVSDGGDPTVAWRIVSLIRERVDKFSALVPQAAYSAATLIVLGADDIVMHPNGNLGPTDPQIRGRRSGKDGQGEDVGFGSEDLQAFLRFSRETVGLTEGQHLQAVFSRFCEEVGSVAVGVAARSALLSVSMGEKLLLLHMRSEQEKAAARAISEKLTKDFFHHGYPVNRTEAKEIGLKVADRDEDLEKLMWDIWDDISDELKLREPHNPVTVLRDSPLCQPLFASWPMIQLPANLPPQVAQQVYQQALAQVSIQHVPPAVYENTHALVESSRFASRFVTRGMVFATRQADLQIRLSTVIERQGWITWPRKEADAAATPPVPVADSTVAPGAPSTQPSGLDSMDYPAGAPAAERTVKRGRHASLKRK